MDGSGGNRQDTIRTVLVVEDDDGVRNLIMVPAANAAFR